MIDSLINILFVCHAKRLLVDPKEMRGYKLKSRRKKYTPNTLDDPHPLPLFTMALTPTLKFARGPRPKSSKPVLECKTYFPVPEN